VVGTSLFTTQGILDHYRWKSELKRRIIHGDVSKLLPKVDDSKESIAAVGKDEIIENSAYCEPKHRQVIDGARGNWDGDSFVTTIRGDVE
jgi:hypothetical protein